MHEKGYYQGMELQGQPELEHDLTARLKRWDEKGRERAQLVAVPSTCIELADALETEKIFKARAAMMAGSLLKQGDKVLDVGCGAGIFAEAFIPYIQIYKGSYVGIDQSEWIAKFCKKRLQKNIHLCQERIKIENRLATRLTRGNDNPFQISEFDLIINGQNLIHVVDDDEVKLIAEQQCEVLKPGGKMFWYGPCTNLNESYMRNPRKNVDTKIRSEQEIVNFFLPHHIELSQNQIFHDLYFNSEIYSFMEFEKTEQCS